MPKLIQRLGHKIWLKMIFFLYRTWDSNKTSILCHKHSLIYSCAHLRQIFQTVDKNGDGFLTTDELYDVIMSCGRPFRMSMVKGVVEKLDKSGDGRLNFEEFLNMIDLA